MEDKLLKELNNKYMILRNYCLNNLNNNDFKELIDLFDKAYYESLRQINNINVRIMLDKEDDIGSKIFNGNSLDKKFVTTGSLLYLLGISPVIASNLGLFTSFLNAIIIGCVNRKVLNDMDKDINSDKDVILYKNNLNINLRLKNGYIQFIGFLIDEELATTLDEVEKIFSRPKRNIPVDIIFLQAKTSETYDLGEILKFNIEEKEINQGVGQLTTFTQ